MNYRRYIAMLFVLLCIAVYAQKKIVFYNVENLFDTRHDSLYQDTEYTPDGDKHWTYQKYRTKIDHIAQVIANIGEWQTPMLVGLCEVENDYCLQSLTKFSGLKNYGYQYLHHDGPDVRGIDCALLYDPLQFELLTHQFISVPLSDRPTREFLYAQGEMIDRTHRHTQKDTLHIYVCHMPSRLNGKASEHRRQTALKVLQTHIDSVLSAQPNAHIIIMGDFNQEPEDNLPPLQNLMLPFHQAGKGTYKYKGIWNCLDQCYITANMAERTKTHIFDADWLFEENTKYLGEQPWRTYKGWRYSGGYSDHLPIWIEFLPLAE